MSTRDYRLIECEHCHEYTWETDRRSIASIPGPFGELFFKSYRDVPKDQREYVSYPLVCTTCYRKLLPGEAVAEMFNEAEE